MASSLADRSASLSTKEALPLQLIRLKRLQSMGSFCRSASGWNQAQKGSASFLINGEKEELAGGKRFALERLGKGSGWVVEALGVLCLGVAK